MPVRLQTLFQKKKDKQPITMLTAYDFLTAQIVSEVGVDIILVGDSLGNVFSGHSTTLPVTLEDIIYHSKAVSRGNQHSFLVADMPFLSYQVSIESAKMNAGRLIKEGAAHGVKMEVGESQLPTVEAILGMGIPVVAHLGFTPQSLHQLGGYRIQGRTNEQAEKMIEIATALDKMGCAAILLEMVPSGVAKKITESIGSPTIGIGASSHCDGQVLVTQDLWGMTQKSPKFVKKYAELRNEMIRSTEQFIKEVQSRAFPEEAHYCD